MKRKKRNYLLVLFNILSISIMYGQIDMMVVHITGTERPLIEVINELEQQNSINFYFKKEWIDSIKVPSDLNGQKLTAVLDYVLNSRNIYYVADNQNNIYLSKIKFNLDLNEENPENNISYNNNDISDELNKGSHSIPSALLEKVSIGQKNANTKKFVTLFGIIKDIESGEPLIGASVYIEELKTGTVADANGNYMLSLEKGTYILTYRSVGNETVQKKVTIYSDGRLNIEMKKNMVALDEVIVKEDKYNNTRGMQIGFEQITMKEIKELPPIAGERDILKASLLLPGVQTIGESSAGYNIRGGGADQNLFLINHVPVYNTSHMFGFFSAFDSDVIKSFNLYKSSIPVEYGGRVSSVFDIRTKNGNEKKFSLKGGINPITAKFSVEGPILKDKCSYIVGVRTTYSNWILNRIENPDIRNSNVYFNDVVSNINIAINDNNNVGVFGYFSNDNFRLPNNVTYNYYNLGSSVNWQHFFGKKLYSNLSLVYSNYNLKVLNQELESNAYVYKHEIKHYELKHQLSYNPSPNHELKFGYSAIFYSVNPGKYQPEGDQSTHNYFNLEEETAIESAVYIGDRIDIGPNLGVEGGLRYSFYDFLGPKTVLNYLDNERPALNTLSDTSYFNNLESIKRYSGLDIRLSLRYLINSESSVKLAYNRINQYLFLLSNTISISPTDRWKLCDNYTPPITGEQYSIGYYKDFSKRNIETSVEIYYKNMDHLKEFKNGADPEKNEHLERDLISGIGRGYGFEVMFKKTHGKVNGWINYTYSKSELKFTGNTVEEIINQGTFFPANSDRPHNINFTANVKSNRRLSMSANFTYSTGRPTTYPVSKYLLGSFYNYNNDEDIPASFPVINYSDRNQARIPDYFRVDLAFNLEGNLNRKKIAHAYWTLAVYNLTGRKNAYSVYFTNENGNLTGHKISVFANPIVTLTYNFKLGNYSSD